MQRIARIRIYFLKSNACIASHSETRGPIAPEVLGALQNLPHALTELHCTNTGIRKIENLPETLKIFDCSTNSIRKLENLPNDLVTLHCRFSSITKLENLPLKLNELKCDGNYIRKIENLSQNIEKVYCAYNQLTKIENLPNVLQLDVHNNPIWNMIIKPDIKYKPMKLTLIVGNRILALHKM
jgi:Leucine-rich repeat (LRR) protein